MLVHRHVVALVVPDEDRRSLRVVDSLAEQ
jgi:hypothetical protein